jgi:hypothetical protein
MLRSIDGVPMQALKDLFNLGYDQGQRDSEVILNNSTDIDPMDFDTALEKVIRNHTLVVKVG